MRRRSLAAALLPLALAIAVAACGGTPGEDKPNEQSQGTPAEAVKTDGFDSSARSRCASSRARARAARATRSRS